jgi:hypothetical protein
VRLSAGVCDHSVTTARPPVQQPVQQPGSGRGFPELRKPCAGVDEHGRQHILVMARHVRGSVAKDGLDHMVRYAGGQQERPRGVPQRVRGGVLDAGLLGDSSEVVLGSEAVSGAPCSNCSGAVVLRCSRG